jgi:hypothetical protein
LINPRISATPGHQQREINKNKIPKFADMAKLINLKSFKHFFTSSSAGGIILLLCVVLFLVIANSPLSQPFSKVLN